MIFKRNHHWILSSSRWDHTTPCWYVTRFTNIVPSMRRSPPIFSLAKFRALFSSLSLMITWIGRVTWPMNRPSLFCGQERSSVRPSTSFDLQFVNVIILAKYTLWRSSLCTFLQLPVNSLSLLRVLWRNLSIVTIRSDVPMAFNGENNVSTRCGVL